MTVAPLTKAQQRAARWLFEHGGDGCFDRHGILLAGGETAPVTRATWNVLRDCRLVETYNPAGAGRGRLRLTAAGHDLAATLEPTAEVDA